MNWGKNDPRNKNILGLVNITTNPWKINLLLYLSDLLLSKSIFYLNAIIPRIIK